MAAWNRSNPRPPRSLCGYPPPPNPPPAQEGSAMKRSRNTTFGGRRLKAIGLGIAVAVAATGLAACGGGTSSGDASGTVSFFSWDKQETMQPVLDEFQKENPTIK